MTTNKFLGISSAFAVAIFAIVGVVHADTLYRQLEVGMSGSDVGSLQTFLAKDITLYPQGLVTNYFGFLTKSAVANFQSRNGIPAVGRVGPMTLPVLNAQMNGGSGVDMSAPIISGANTTVGVNTASIRWNTSEMAAGIVYYSTSGPSMTESQTDVTIGGTVAMTDTLQRTSHVVNVAGLAANTTYYYVIYTKDASGNVQVTWPSTFRTTN